MTSCTLLQDTSKTDIDNAHSLSSITTSPTFSAVDTSKVALINYGSGNYQLQIKTSHTAGFEYKGIYLECDVQKNGANTAGVTGYPTNAYGIADVTNSQKRYAGPLRIKQWPEKCGWDTANGEVINESLTATVSEIDIVLENGGSGSF